MAQPAAAQPAAAQPAAAAPPPPQPVAAQPAAGGVTTPSPPQQPAGAQPAAATATATVAAAPPPPPQQPAPPQRVIDHRPPSWTLIPGIGWIALAAIAITIVFWLNNLTEDNVFKSGQKVLAAGAVFKSIQSQMGPATGPTQAEVDAKIALAKAEAVAEAAKAQLAAEREMNRNNLALAAKK